MKKIFVVCFSIILLIFASQHFTKPAEAFSFRYSRNIFFPYRQEVLKMINKAIEPIQALIDSLTSRTDDLEDKVADLEERLKGLEEIAHCPPGMVPEIRFEGDLGPLKCRLVDNPQPTIEPQPTSSPEAFQVSCGVPEGSSSSSEFTISANKPLKSCLYTTSPIDNSEPETSVSITPNDNICSFTENNCDRQIWVGMESFDNENQECLYEAVACNP
ncbi:MAG TPA: hypothetical protein VMW41_00570 [Candidatus Bathyarchaeia archaeon]|nr:hypothetical protein [Candidatus Bathyarchaeia archaeon]